ncbi:MAG: ATP-binding protein [Oscillospiraceae bacterium]|nr:ATP-binding protein [Oscillospiraceae bacterium]
MKNRIERKEYLDKLISLKDKQIIKVITGIRRCGKSTLMEIFQDYLRENKTDETQIISINLEDYDFDELREPKELYKYIKQRLQKDKMTYIFIDEIQQCRDFPRVIDSLYIKENTDIYLTGSNADLLSSEIATLISGRYIEVSMLPLSFKEYVLSTGSKSDLQKKYREYLEISSFPYALNLKDQPKEIRDYLDSIYNTIVIKDIAGRKKIHDTMILESVTRFIFDNIGNPLSSKKIADTMTSNGRKTDAKTIEKYITALTESFIIYEARRFDIKGKEYLKTLGKYYAVDMGMRYALLGSRSTDVGHILENVVYLELIRRGFRVSVGKLDILEVDFVAEEPHRIIYYQVAVTVRDEKTLQRELAPLQKINDHYQKFILTLDEDPQADYNGIRRVNVLEWLIGEIS